MTYQTGTFSFRSLSNTYVMGCCASFFKRASPPCCLAIVDALSVSAFSRYCEKARPADWALYAPSAPSVETPNGGASLRRLPEQMIVLTARRPGEAKYPRHTADFPSWPLASGVNRDSSRAGGASGDHFMAR